MFSTLTRGQNPGARVVAICPVLTPMACAEDAAGSRPRHFSLRTATTNRKWLTVPAGEKCGQQHPETNIVVPVVRIVPVAVSAPHVPVRIVERPATKNAGLSGLPPNRLWPSRSRNPDNTILARDKEQKYSAHIPFFVVLRENGYLPSATQCKNYLLVLTFIHPPRRRPISTSIAATCWY